MNCMTSSSYSICDTNASWSPPPLAQWTWDNSTCDNSSSWLATFYRDLQLSYNDEAHFGGGNAAIGLEYLVDYIWNSLPSNVSCCPTAGQVTDYMIADSAAANLSFSRLYNHSIDNCNLQVCPKLEWPGDPDVSGNGMMVAYFMEAVFATIYFAILTFTGSEGLHENVARNKLMKGVRRCVNCFAKSVDTFLYSTIVFAGAMVIAAVVRYVAAARHPHDDTSIYGLLGSVYMSAFSILPALAIQTQTPDLQQHWLALFLWFVVIALSVTLEVQYRVTFQRFNTPAYYDNIDRFGGSMTDMFWVAYCDDVYLSNVLGNMATAAHGLIVANSLWFLYEVCKRLYRYERVQRLGTKATPAWWTRQKSSVGKYIARLRIRRVLAVIGWLDGFVCLGLMWPLVIIFDLYRHRVAARAGDSDEDTKWTFGQVLAIAQWIPVGIDLYNSYWELDQAKHEPYEAIKGVELESGGRK